MESIMLASKDLPDPFTASAGTDRGGKGEICRESDFATDVAIAAAAAGVPGLTQGIEITMGAPIQGMIRERRHTST